MSTKLCIQKENSASTFNRTYIVHTIYIYISIMVDIAQMERSSIGPCVDNFACAFSHTCALCVRVWVVNWLYEKVILKNLTIFQYFSFHHQTHSTAQQHIIEPSTCYAVYESTIYTHMYIVQCACISIVCMVMVYGTTVYSA